MAAALGLDVFDLQSIGSSVAALRLLNTRPHPYLGVFRPSSAAVWQKDPGGVVRWSSPLTTEQDDMLVRVVVGVERV